MDVKIDDIIECRDFFGFADFLVLVPCKLPREMQCLVNCVTVKTF